MTDWLYKKVVLSNPTPGLPSVPGPPPPDILLTGPEKIVREKNLSGEFGIAGAIHEGYLRITFENTQGEYWLPVGMFSIREGSPGIS